MLPATLSSSPRVEFLLGGAEVLAAAGDRQAALSCAREALTITELSRLVGADKIRQLVRELEAGWRSSANRFVHFGRCATEV